MRSLTVLGSTGSIGTQTLDVATRLGMKVDALVAGRNADLLIEQIRAHAPVVVACDPSIARVVRDAVPSSTLVVSGPEAVLDVASRPVDTVVAAIPGMAGLAPVRAALTAGLDVALATKEAMVVAGSLVTGLARDTGARITPVDSEHAGVDQVLVGERIDAVRRVVLTASGGPFREGPTDLSTVSPADALAHPTWSMGAKVTIDSATLFNKGLEVLEAHALFGISLDAIDVVVHPQSLVHALVEFHDGSLKAQVGAHDMRLPITWALKGVERPPLHLQPFDVTGTWTFHAPDRARFPALDLAYRAGRMGGTAPASLNAADEIAVTAFLEGRLRFDQIPRVLDYVLDHASIDDVTWSNVEAADDEARKLAGRATQTLA